MSVSPRLLFCKRGGDGGDDFGDSVTLAMLVPILMVTREMDSDGEGDGGGGESTTGLAVSQDSR